VVMLMGGTVLVEGGLDVLKASADPRVQDFLARRPAPEPENAEAYLQSLVGT